MNDKGNMIQEEYRLIVTIVSKGAASGIVKASKEAGSGGGTILLGRGTAGKSIYLDILGINFDPEKEIVLTLAPRDKAGAILQAIVEEGSLNKPGKGIGFVVNVRGLAGIFHLLAAEQSS
jgi:hypothetical protein